MIHKTAIILKQLVTAHYFGGRGMTAGEVSKKTGYSKSTCRRVLQFIANQGLASLEVESYKSTGKRVFYVTEEGRIWNSNYREMFQ